MAYLPDILTLSRIAGALSLLFMPLGSMLFWAVYLYCGLSDCLDGYLARKLKVNSEKGAFLDSLADLVLAGILALILYPYLLKLPFFYLCWLIMILLIRCAALLLGVHKYHTLPFWHSKANKICGLLLYTTPLALIVLPLNIVLSFLGLSCSYAALEELYLTWREPSLKRDR